MVRRSGNSQLNYFKRFTIAHEIAHLLLHRPILREGVTDDVLYRSPHLGGTQETEANKMAADILEAGGWYAKNGRRLTLAVA